MKKLITIILALIMTLFTAPNRSAVQPSVPAPNSRNPNPKPVGEGFGFLFVLGDM